MPNIKSAIKRVKVSTKKTNANKMKMSAIRTELKKAKASVAANDEGVEMILKNAQKTLDKAAAKGYIHKNAAARLKSSLVRSAKA